jgi:hypothetical protein
MKGQKRENQIKEMINMPILTKSSKTKLDIIPKRRYGRVEQYQQLLEKNKSEAQTYQLSTNTIANHNPVYV